MDCKDFILDNIVGIDFYLSAHCSIAMPANIAIQSMAATAMTLPSPAFSIRMDESADIAMETPTIKASNAREAAGNIFTHDVQIPIYIGREVAQNMVTTLQGNDFHIIYIKADGSRAMGYSLPNTSYCDIDVSPSINTTSTLKVKLLSMSPFITIDE